MRAIFGSVLLVIVISCWKISPNISKVLVSGKPGAELQCGKSFVNPTRTKRIIFGEDSIKGAWPWVVSISFKGEHVASGVIINENWVLTDALNRILRGHRNKPNGIKVTTGAHEILDYVFHTDEESITEHDVVWMKAHSTYQYNHKTVATIGDIALLKVKQPFNFTESVQPICLPSATDVFEAGESCYAVGWGADRGSADSPFVLQQMKSEIYDLENCLNGYNVTYEGPEHEGLMCFGDGKKAVCHGDDASPLMCQRNDRWVIAGVASWTTNYPDIVCEKPGVFSRVSAYLDWIKKSIG